MRITSNYSVREWGWKHKIIPPVLCRTNISLMRRKQWFVWIVCVFAPGNHKAPDWPCHPEEGELSSMLNMLCWTFSTVIQARFHREEKKNKQKTLLANAFPSCQGGKKPQDKMTWVSMILQRCLFKSIHMDTSGSQRPSFWRHKKCISHSHGGWTGAGLVTTFMQVCKSRSATDCSRAQ